MFYLRVAHVEDSDGDYFKFNHIGSAALYIEENNIEDFTISDIILDQVPEEDYTLISLT